MRVKLTEAGEKAVAQMEIPEAVKEQWESIWHEGNLVLFMTYGMSLRKWDEAGTLERELKLYRELKNNLKSISIVTYGNASEPYIEGINVLYNNTWMPDWLYSIFAPWIHRHILREADYFKTNQIPGSWCAVIAKILFKKRLIIRQGYPWLQTLKEHKAPIWKRILAEITETIAYSAADSIIVTTERDKKTIIEKSADIYRKTHVISNYIDTDLFKPDPEKRVPNRILYVGRIAYEKNLKSLILAVKSLDIELIMIGDGEIKQQILTLASRIGVIDIKFLGIMKNEDLVQEYQKADQFILPSIYEGNPKALMEAMACGCMVIGTNVRGIKELIDDGKTGFLCEITPTSINAALCRAHFTSTNHPKEADEIRNRARDMIVNNHSLRLAVKKELKILRGVQE
ncbi:MAG: glycosyltransferase family 4 protein [Candidatus Ratteibacteria bacterium]|nr:glycosyltransferase family 4 protein [Candidatus Ratteibacteria bacterium]